MTLKRVSRVWYEHEKYQLWVGYEFGVPFEIIAAYLKRTRTAINKQIARYGVRGRRLTDIRKKIKNWNDYHLLLVQCGLDTDTVGHERSYTRSWKPSQNTFETLLGWGLRFPTPWQPKPRPKQDTLPKKSGVGRTFRHRHDEHASFRVVISYLGRYGMNVTPIKNAPPHSCSYSLNNVPVKEYTLLVKANKLRLEKGEPIFFVEGITSE